jgi:hypothetical protein
MMHRLAACMCYDAPVSKTWHGLKPIHLVVLAGVALLAIGAIVFGVVAHADSDVAYREAVGATTRFYQRIKRGDLEDAYAEAASTFDPERAHWPDLVRWIQRSERLEPNGTWTYGFDEICFIALLRPGSGGIHVRVVEEDGDWKVDKMGQREDVEECADIDAI